MPVAIWLLMLAVTPKENCESVRKAARFSALFERVELEKLVQTVSDATCKTFIMGENVRGKISLIGPENGHVSLDADQFYAAFLTALDANGLAAVPAGRFMRIVEKARAKAAPIPLVTESTRFPSRDEVVTRVFVVQHVELDALKNLLGQFLSPGADVIAFPPQTLIVNELGSNLERLDRLVDALDVERKPRDELKIVPVRFAEAHALGDEVTRVLTPKSPRPEETLSLTADERSNRLIVVASSGLMNRVLHLIEQLDVPLPGEGRARVHPLSHADAKELAANLSEVIAANRPAQRPGGTASTTDPKVTANESLNALVIVASNADYRNLLELVRQLDVPRKQVFIETLVLEVTASKDQQFGASGHFFAAPDGVPLLLGSQPSGAPSSVDMKTLGAAAGLLFGVQGPQVAALTQTLGLTLGKYGLAYVALQNQGDTNVMSMPTILTADNKEAEISVGQRFPFQQGINPLLASQLAGSAAGGAATLAAAAGSVSREKVELKLVVKPHIGEGGAVRMDITQSAEEIAGQDPKGLGPITSTRAQKATIIAQDSETVVLGGIMQDKTIESVSKTPVLGDIPILGRLFRFEEKKKAKVNLLVFLTPHVIERPEDLKRLADLKYEERQKWLAQRWDSGDERAPMNFQNRPGPLSAMMRALVREQARPENGGSGAPDERLIAPSSNP